MSAKRKSVPPRVASLADRAAVARHLAEIVTARGGPDPTPPKPADGLPKPASIAAGLDVTGLSLLDLENFYSLAMTLAEVATAIGCQPRCQRDAPIGFNANLLGSFAEWVGEVSAFVANRCENEARRRVPADRDEAEHRLATILPAMVDGLDLAAIVAEAMRGLSLGAAR